MTRRLYRTILLSDLPHLEAEGWRPAVQSGGAVGCDPWCGGTLATVLVVREGYSTWLDYLIAAIRVHVMVRETWACDSELALIVASGLVGEGAR